MVYSMVMRRPVTDWYSRAAAMISSMEFTAPVGMMRRRVSSSGACRLIASLMPRSSSVASLWMPLAIPTVERVTRRLLMSSASGCSRMRAASMVWS